MSVTITSMEPEAAEARPALVVCCESGAGARRCREPRCGRTFCDECAVAGERETGFCYMCLDESGQGPAAARRRRQ